MFLSIPFLSNSSNKNITNDIQILMRKFYPQINLNLIFKNNFSIESFFRYKDIIPSSVLSNVVYKYECEQCTATYIGETTRHLKTRIAEHRGLSARTGKPLISPCHSSIRDHCSLCDHDMKSSNFSVIHKCFEASDTRISESIMINKYKPSLNTMESFNLNIMN